MSGGGYATQDCLSLALAFHQAPGRFPDLLHGQAALPKGLSALLRLAGGARPEDEGLSPLPLVPSSELQEAALFFIEQVMLAHGADYYRILGVRPDASLDEIKENHRLLMRLFHPDRDQGTVEAERTEKYAARINQAYTAIRLPSARATYDAMLRQSRKTISPVPQPRVVREPQPEPAFNLSIPPTVKRHLPEFVLGSFGLLALLVVGTMFLTRQPTGPIGAGEGKPYRAPMPKSSPQVLSPKPAFDFLETKRQTDPPVELAMAPDREITVEKMPAVSKPINAEKDNRYTKDKSVASRLPVGSAEPEDVPVQVVESEPSRPASPSHSVEQPLEPRQLQDDEQEKLFALIQRMSALYERGDLNGFLALLDENARTDQGGKSRIRRDYEDLFRTTDSRRLHAYDMNWTRENDRFNGEGNFQAVVLRKGETSPRVFNGTIRLEVQFRNGVPLIRGMFHKSS